MSGSGTNRDGTWDVEAYTESYQSSDGTIRFTSHTKQTAPDGTKSDYKTDYHRDPEGKHTDVIEFTRNNPDGSSSWEKTTITYDEKTRKTTVTSEWKETDAKGEIIDEGKETHTHDGTPTEDDGASCPPELELETCESISFEEAMERAVTEGMKELVRNMWSVEKEIRDEWVTRPREDYRREYETSPEDYCEAMRMQEAYFDDTVGTLIYPDPEKPDVSPCGCRNFELIILSPCGEGGMFCQVEGRNLMRKLDSRSPIVNPDVQRSFEVITMPLARFGAREVVEEERIIVQD
jgi:hypothetical protein